MPALLEDLQLPADQLEAITRCEPLDVGVFTVPVLSSRALLRLSQWSESLDPINKK